MKATSVFHEKHILNNRATGNVAIAELKIWKVIRSKDYPLGRKYPLFLVADGHILLGIDNHKPKGSHLHLGNRELPYLYRNERSLLADFWEFARKAGFEP
ncbi:MAG: hypothetical protein HY072_07015 [Deltaproteobacteria bacterium]|nr:hypothetical protein [Deltaproteobacteria bacterium]